MRDETVDVEAPAHPRLDERGRTLYPLTFPDLVVDPGSSPPHRGASSSESISSDGRPLLLGARPELRDRRREPLSAPRGPFEEPTGHRPLDYWGRTLLDHLIRLLPKLLAEGAMAYVMQLSIVGQLATERLLASVGLRARVVEFSFFPFSPLFVDSAEQIARVEQLSDAYHIDLGGEDIMVAYLLEVSREA